MGYLWAEIFIEKTSRELYKIYIGNSLITGDEAKHYAKKELEARGVDFENIDNYRKAWEFAYLIDQIKSDELERSSRKSANLSAKKIILFSPIVYIVVFIASLIYFYFKNKVFDVNLSIIIASVITYSFLFYSIYRMRIDNRLKRLITKANTLKKEINEEVLDNDKANIYKEINENHLKLRKESSKTRRVSLYISLAMSLFLIIYSLLS